MLTGTWVVYLKDPLDPEDDVWLASCASESDADAVVRDHSREHGNDEESYSVEWEEYI